jgi:hypothetical protein
MAADASAIGTGRWDPVEGNVLGRAHEQVDVIGHDDPGEGPYMARTVKEPERRDDEARMQGPGEERVPGAGGAGHQVDLVDRAEAVAAERGVAAVAIGNGPGVHASIRMRDRPRCPAFRVPSDAIRGAQHRSHIVVSDAIRGAQHRSHIVAPLGVRSDAIRGAQHRSHIISPLPHHCTALTLRRAYWSCGSGAAHRESPSPSSRAQRRSYDQRLVMVPVAL